MLYNFIILCLFPIILFGKNYSTTSKAMAIDKNSACQKALNSAREDSLNQAGTLIISNFSNSTTIENNNYSTLKNKELKAISVGVAKLISKKETVELTTDYQFYCTVSAIFSVDEDEMKKSIDKFLETEKREKDRFKIYIKATGYSAEGQSKYRAFKVATIDARRNLLDEIKGSEILSTTISENGKYISDQIINNTHGTLKFTKVLSKKYDEKTKSAEVVIGISEENLNKNIQNWMK